MKSHAPSRSKFVIRLVLLGFALRGILGLKARRIIEKYDFLHCIRSSEMERMILGILDGPDSDQTKVSCVPAVHALAHFSFHLVCLQRTEQRAPPLRRLKNLTLRAALFHPRASLTPYLI
jgi:hypothetical protein